MRDPKRPVAEIFFFCDGAHYSTPSSEAVNTPPSSGKKFFSQLVVPSDFLAAEVKPECGAARRGTALRPTPPSLTLLDGPVHNPPFLQRRRRHETHLSAEQPPPQEDARLPGPHEHEERAPRPEAPAGQGSQKIDRVKGKARFRPQDRIRKRSEYQVIYDKGQRIPSGSFVLFVLRNALGRPRLGITATRRVGGAVKRNRAKRLVREIFRRHRSEFEDVDIVVNVRAALPGAEYRRVEAELLTRLRPFARKTR